MRFDLSDPFTSQRKLQADSVERVRASTVEAEPQPQNGALPIIERRGVESDTVAAQVGQQCADLAQVSSMVAASSPVVAGLPSSQASSARVASSRLSL